MEPAVNGEGRLAERAEQWRFPEQVARAQTGALVATLQALSGAGSLDAYLGEVLRAIAGQLGGRSASLWLLDEATQSLRLHLEYHDGEVKDAEQSDHPGALPGPAGRTDLGVFEREVGDYGVDTDPYLAPHRQYLLSRGVRRVLVAPLLVDGRPVGTFGIRSPRSEPFSEAERELAGALAGQASLAVQLTRLADQAQRAAVAEERNRMAQEIHDTLAQGFTGIVVQLEAAEDLLGDGTSPMDLGAAREHLRMARELARESLTEARRTVQAIRPLGGELSLVTALEATVRRLQGLSGVTVTLETAPLPFQPSALAAHDLLRAAQEALTNALRHSGATQITLSLDGQGGEEPRIEVSVADNGRGFEVPAALVLGSGLGLVGLRERLERHGGTAEIRSAPGRGTRVRLTLLLPSA